jgi:hypothetical protein
MVVTIAAAALSQNMDTRRARNTHQTTACGPGALGLVGVRWAVPVIMLLFGTCLTLHGIKLGSGGSHVCCLGLIESAVKLE